MSFSAAARSVLAAAALCACATVDEAAAARQSWRGATYDEVVKAWGPPSHSAADSHSWVASSRAPGGAGGMLFGGCDRTVMFRDGRVVDERWSGEPQVCAGYARPR
jgi:hypothetical protein